jgi:hypothetical protein
MELCARLDISLTDLTGFFECLCAGWSRGLIMTLFNFFLIGGGIADVLFAEH